MRFLVLLALRQWAGRYVAATKLTMTGMEEKLAGNDHYSRQADLRRASRSTDRESQGPRFDKTTDVNRPLQDTD